MKTISCVEEKSGHGIQFIGSTGKCTKYGKIKNDDHNQNWYNINSSGPPLIIAIQRNTTISGFYFICILSVNH